MTQVGHRLLHCRLVPADYVADMHIEFHTVLAAGFVASGPLVVLLEVALRIGSAPTYSQQLALFLLVTVVTSAGQSLSQDMKLVVKPA